MAYDGSGFAGYARQQSKRTVQGELETALAKVLGLDGVAGDRPKIKTRVAGRTDAGVHALGQVVSVHLPGGAEERAELEQLGRRLNKLLGDEIVVLRVSEAPEGFDARRSATSRQYRYRILASTSPDPTRRHSVWYTGPLDKNLLDEAAALVVGTHDFGVYCKRSGDASSTRNVVSAAWRSPRGDTGRGEIWFEIEAGSFCHQMIRRVVARSVAVAKGKLPLLAPEEMSTLGCKPAPPHALYLVAVGYAPRATPRPSSARPRG